MIPRTTAEQLYGAPDRTSPAQPAPLLGALVGLVGLVAGIYPANRAARIEPVEALRS